MNKLPFLMKTETNMEKYRVETFWTKEPETIAWIDGFDNGDILFDIGANIGIYSLYCASKHPESRIFAFEPSLNNWKRLVENIRMNKYYNIFPIWGALSNECGVSGFYEENQEIGASGGQLSAIVEQSVFTVTLDKLIITNILNINKPYNIKIDIDGQEFKVIEGMLYTIEKKECKSILIELDEERTDIPLVLEIFKQKGFTIDNEFNYMENHSSIRRAKEGIGCRNVIFTRGDNARYIS